MLIPTFETAAGAFLIAGLLTRAVALLLSALMLTTGFWIKLSVWHTGILGPNGVGGAEVDFLCLVVCLMLFAAGPCLQAADPGLGLERPRRRPESPHLPTFATPHMIFAPRRTTESGHHDVLGQQHLGRPHLLRIG
ncbi:hypothetical protein SMA5143A_3565 [Streptomyces sp. MA5143a]|nr:hypothetical protein SMA5143A_3565 [Streptomyces sp. MA5143a]